MSECLHCEINELVQQASERGETDLTEIASMIAESLVDAILQAAEADQANLMAHAISAVGQIFLEKSGALEGVTRRTARWQRRQGSPPSDGGRTAPIRLI